MSDLNTNIAQPLYITYTIKFKKAFYTNIKKYCVYAKYKDEYNNDKIDLIMEINKNTPTSIVPFEDYITIEKSKISLPKDMFLDNTHGFQLYKNDTLIEPKYYIYSSYLNTVAFTKEFMYSDQDMIKLKYYKELIVVDYPTAKACTFNIEPIFVDKHLLGNHNILV